jgi:hypothetical protein
MASAARKVTSDHPTLARVVEQTVPLGFDMKEDEMKKIGMQMVLPYSKYRSELPDDVKKLLAKYNVDYDGGGKLLAGDDYDHFLYVDSLEQAEVSVASETIPKANWWVMSRSRMLAICQRENFVGWSSSTVAALIGNRQRSKIEKHTARVLFLWRRVAGTQWCKSPP